MNYGVYESEEGTKVRIKVWDTAGENKYKEVVCYHLKKIDVVVLMYDVTDYLSNSLEYSRLREDRGVGGKAEEGRSLG